jgi:alkylhydroperoxidase family enzyme
LYNADTDLLFPPRAIPALREMRGAAWRDLVTGVVEAGSDSPEQMAFILTMARMSNCDTCNADSYRAMHGCTTCAKQSLKRFRGTDEELSGQFQAAKAEVEQYLQKKGNCST